MKTKYFNDEVLNTALNTNTSENKKKNSSESNLISMIKKEGKLSFSVLSVKFGKDYDELKDILTLLEKKLNIKIIYPIIGAPYVTMK